MSATVADPAEVRLRRRIRKLKRQLARTKQTNQDLRDLLASCRANVVAEQESHSAYRLANPPKRETSCPST